ncbi:MAG: hypothetical protein KAH13_02385 [Tenericutes bacterium]|nr:hypothetical protein [Mycoplasmatota bacterium]
MKNNRNTRNSQKSRLPQMSKMVSINPCGFWSLSELCCKDVSNSYK